MRQGQMLSKINSKQREALQTREKWFSDISAQENFTVAGFRIDGGGAHQSKTMMLNELSFVMRTLSKDNDLNYSIICENILKKPSLRARKAVLYRLNQLYGVRKRDAICHVLHSMWNLDAASQPMLALGCALARDPTFRDSSSAVLDASIGERVRWPAFASAFEKKHPGRLTEKMSKSLAQNAASSWTQAGFLRGTYSKTRVRAAPSPVAAAYFAMLATFAGFSGPRLLSCRWLDLLDRPLEERLSLLRQAEGLGLARVRSAGDVLEIDVRQPIAQTFGIGLFGDG